MDTQFWNEGQQPDTKPGPYYVTARQGDKYWLMRGPFALHVDALAAVKETMCKACDLDARAHWMQWGTCRKPADLVRDDPGKMNFLFEVAA